MSAPISRKPLDTFWQLGLALGVLSIVLGIIMLTWPGATLLVAGIVFAVFLLTSGVFQIAGALVGNESHRVLGAVSGGLAIILGCIALRDAAETLLLLAIWIGIGWLFRGINVLSVAFADENLPQRGWAIFTGIVTVLAAIVLLVSPFESLWTLLLVSGIWAIILGFVEIGSAFQLRSSLRRHQVQ